MNDTRNDKIWELILTSEVIKENIAEFENKLAEEKAKYNKLLDETVELEKTQANLNLELFHLKNHNGYLGAEIAQKTADAKLLDAEVATLDINLKTSKDNRDKLELEIKDLWEKQEALAKRYEFLIKNYDYTINVKALSKNQDDFKSLMKSNEAVNHQVGDFLLKLTAVRDEEVANEFG